MGRGTADIKKMRTGALLCERREILSEARGKVVRDAQRLRGIEAELVARTRQGVVAGPGDRAARLGRR